LWRIVVNAAHSARRTAVLRERRATVWHDGSFAEEDPELAAALAALPERQRIVLFLRFYADLDYARIAEVLDIESGTVASTLSAAKRALRVLLTEEAKA
jgi:RNA polymerase sigma-70 factor (ECF subfamily)